MLRGRAGMVFPTPLIFYSLGGDLVWELDGRAVPIAGDAYLEWFNHLIGESNIPQTISIAYAHNESDLPLEYAAAVCQLFLQLGALGVSVLVSSGDFGVGDEDCEDDQGNIRFTPEFPSSCTCIILSPRTRQAPQVQVAHQTAIVSQVPGSPASGELQTTNPRLRRASPEAASRTTLHARATSSMRWTDSSRPSATFMPAASSALSAVP
jgi:hypothetical protein